MDTGLTTEGIEFPLELRHDLFEAVTIVEHGDFKLSGVRKEGGTVMCHDEGDRLMGVVKGYADPTVWVLPDEVEEDAVVDVHGVGVTKVLRFVFDSFLEKPP